MRTFQKRTAIVALSQITQVTRIHSEAKGTEMSNESPLNGHQPSKIETDTRLDPRIKKYIAGMPQGAEKPNVSSREELLAQENSPAALAALERQTALFDSMDSEEIAPSAGLSVRTETLTSSPDGNTIKIRYILPDNDETLPCVYYIHGGRMEMSSCYEGNYKTWGRMIAAKGVAVAMVEFRNSVDPSSVPEIAPFPAGLNDCISGLKWVHANATTLKIDAKRIIVAGESGGGNLVLAVGMKLKQDGELGLLKGIYSLCPTSPVSGRSRSTRLPSRMRASCSSSGTTAPPWPTASRPLTPATLSHGPASPSERMSKACRRRSSASTSAIRCAMRASPSTVCCWQAAFQRVAAK
jgi:acetyl esterase/lipase